MINAKSTRVRKVPQTSSVHGAHPAVPGTARIVPAQAVPAESTSLTPATKAEITRQLREMKTQLNKEIIEDLRDMQAELIKKITPIITATVEQQVRVALSTVHIEVDKKVTKAMNDVTAHNNKQLAVSNQSTRELMRAASTEICDDVYRQVINEINEKVVPKVDNMMQWVNYKTRDEDETIDSYRRAVERQANPELRMLTDGKHDGRIISPYVRTFFGED